MIAIIVNGEKRTMDEPGSLAALCEELGLPERGVAVAVNYELVPKQKIHLIELRDRDIVEIVTAAAGG